MLQDKYPVQSAEQIPVVNEHLLNGLAEDARMAETTLMGDEQKTFMPLAIGKDERHLISTGEETKYYTVQEPVAFIRTGRHSEGEPNGDNYALVRVSNFTNETSADPDRTYVLAHMGLSPHEPTVPVGEVTPDGLAVGRKPGKNHPVRAEGDTTSRLHFTISMTEEGAINVANHGKNGTDIVYPTESHASPDASTEVFSEPPRANTVAAAVIDYAMRGGKPAEVLIRHIPWSVPMGFVVPQDRS